MLRLSLLLALSRFSLVLAQEDAVQYGVDCSFPIHHNEFPSKACNHTFAEDRVKFYEEYMQGCRDYYGSKGKACDQTEQDRSKLKRDGERERESKSNTILL